MILRRVLLTFRLWEKSGWENRMFSLRSTGILDVNEIQNNSGAWSQCICSCHVFFVLYILCFDSLCKDHLQAACIDFDFSCWLYLLLILSHSGIYLFFIWGCVLKWLSSHIQNKSIVNRDFKSKGEMWKESNCAFF